MTYLRFGLSAVLMLSGLVVAFISILGTYRFRFALNRMHTAALMDTLALMLVMASLLVAMGLRLATWKLLLIVAFMWMASPIASHLLCLLEVSTDEELEEQVQFQDRTGEEEE